MRLSSRTWLSLPQNFFIGSTVTLSRRYKVYSTMTMFIVILTHKMFRLKPIFLLCSHVDSYLCTCFLQRGPGTNSFYNKPYCFFAICGVDNSSSSSVYQITLAFSLMEAVRLLLQDLSLFLQALFLAFLSSRSFRFHLRFFLWYHHLRLCMFLSAP